MPNKHPILPEKAFGPSTDNQPGLSGNHAFEIYGANGEYDNFNDRFNTQAEFLIDRLNDLCTSWDIPQDTTASLAFFKVNFIQRNYRQPAGYYAEVKFWIEHLYLLLISEKYPLEERKSRLYDFTESLMHCAPSVITRLQEIIIMLRGPSASEVSDWLALFRTEIIAALSAEFCESLIAPLRQKIRRMEKEKRSIEAMEDPSEWHITRLSTLEYDLIEEKLAMDDIIAREIHYQKHFLTVSADLGWNPMIRETVIDMEEAKLSEQDEKWFKNAFCKAYSPQSIILHIAEKITEAVQRRLSTLLKSSGDRPLIVQVSNLGEISACLEGLPLVNELPEPLDWLLYSIENTDPDSTAMGFRFTGEEHHYCLARPVQDMAQKLIPFFWSWLVREDAPWHHPSEDSLLTPPDETGIRYWILPFAPTFCFAITPENQWFPLDANELSKTDPSIQPFWIAPVSASEAAEWGLELPRISRTVFLNYIHHGKKDFRGCPMEDPLDLRGAPLSFVQTALKVLTDNKKILTLQQLRLVFVEDSVPPLQTLRDIVLGLTMDNTLTIMDDEGDPDPSDFAGTAFAAIFRSMLVPSEKLSQFFEDACFGEGSSKKYLSLPSDCVDATCLFCLEFALQYGNYLDGLKVTLNAKSFHDHEVERLARLFSACKKGVQIRFPKTGFTPLQIDGLIDALQSGHFPEGGGFALKIPKEEASVSRNDIMTHFASTLVSGRCPRGLRLRLSGCAFGTQHNIETLVRIVTSKNCPADLHLDFIGSFFTKEALATLVQALKNNDCPKGLDIHLSKTEATDDPMRRLQEELQLLLNPGQAPLRPISPPEEEEKETIKAVTPQGTSWAQFFSPPRIESSGSLSSDAGMEVKFEPLL